MLLDFNDPEMKELFEGFLVESDELLDNISQDLIIIETNPNDFDLINKIFRGFHTIKGTSSFMGLDNISGLTHEAEELLNKLRKSELVFTGDIGDVLLNVHDIIREMIEKIKSNDDSPTYTEDAIAKIIELRDGKSATLVKAATEIVDQNVVNQDNNFNKVLDNDFAKGDGDFTDEELELLQAAFADMNSQMLNDFKSTTSTQSQNKITNVTNEDTKPIQKSIAVEPKQLVSVKPNKETKIETKIETIVETKAELKSNPQAQNNNAPTGSNESLRIDVSRLETLMNLSGELVLGRNRLLQLSNTLDTEIANKDSYRNLLEAATQIDFVTSEIQTAVMKMRMVPVGKLFQKAQRIVRDLSKESGKFINLIIRGEETEIDKSIVEELNDPLVHMIRNSCDHGVEIPEVRENNGKNKVGNIILEAEHHGNHIIITISDDGAGMDVEKLKNKAVEKGLMTREHADLMSDNEALKIIFLPGFSTAAKVTGVSGRGVGMDVVRTNIEKLRGMIDIESNVGVGSKFFIKLPLTLAIIQGLLINVQNEIYAIPLSAVDEVVSIELESVKTINNREVIKIRDNVYPIVRLNEKLKCENQTTDLTDKYVVIVGIGYDKVGLVVDNLLGQEEIVIKSLGEYLGNIIGMAGATIRGDGKVIMILDIETLIRSIP